jgi:hypothetical protein
MSVCDPTGTDMCCNPQDIKTCDPDISMCERWAPYGLDGIAMESYISTNPNCECNIDVSKETWRAATGGCVGSMSNETMCNKLWDSLDKSVGGACTVVTNPITKTDTGRTGNRMPYWVRGRLNDCGIKIIVPAAQDQGADHWSWVQHDCFSGDSDHTSHDACAWDAWNGSNRASYSSGTCQYIRS